MKKSWRLVGSILIVAVFVIGGVFLYLNKHSENIQTENPQSADHGSLLEKIVSIYNDSKYSNNRQPVCLNYFIKNPQKKNTPGFESACPIIKGIDISSADYSKEGLEELLVLYEIMDNSEPISKYLFMERSTSSSEDYQSIYSNFIIRKVVDLGESNYRENILLSENVDSFRSDAFTVEMMPVNSETDLAIVTDVYDSGVYNMYTTIYEVVFSGDTTDYVSISPAKIINTTSDSVSVLGQSNNADPLDGSSNSELGVNTFFDKSNKTVHIGGFLPFSTYPCNYDNVYSFFTDRLILVSTFQAKDCKKYGDNILPRDIPDNFDNTPVEIYKIPPSILERAKSIAL